MIQKTYYKTYRALPDPPYVTFTNEYAGNNTFQLYKFGTPDLTGLEYSVDNGANWTTISGNVNVTVAQGGNVKLRGSNGFISTSDSNFIRMWMALGDYSISGNMATLFDYINYDTFTSIPNYGCYNMFSRGTSLYSTDENANLRSVNITFGNITTMGMKCCAAMFEKARNISKTTNISVDFSSVTSYGSDAFRYMLSNCNIKLVTNIILPSATTVPNYGLSYMFAGSGVTTPPDMSHITSIGSNGCAYMFQNCSSLLEVPDLSNLTYIGNNALNGAFYGCTSITSGADFSKTTTVEGSGLYNAYNNCSNLNFIIAPNVSSWNTSIFYEWVNGVAASGLFKKPTALTVPEGTSGYPTGWTVENY